MMIQVTRLNGKPFVLNAVLIETVEETPDTIITLTNGRKYIVRENMTEVIALVKDYMRHIGAFQISVKSQDLEETND
jgi:flagellar protein FlbD